MRFLTTVAALALASLALAPRASSAQAPAAAPPARLPSASPPPPRPQPVDTVRARVVLLVPATPPPPPPPVPREAPGASPLAASVLATPPADATMRCKDGTYLTGAPAADRCRERGGVAAILPARPIAPPAPRPDR